MKKKISLMLTPEERKTLRSKKIPVKALENYSINEISEFLGVPKKRAHELVDQLFSDVLPIDKQIMTTSIMTGSDMARIANAVDPFRNRGVMTAARLIQEQVENVMSPFRGINSGFFSAIDEINKNNSLLTSSGLGAMLQAVNKDIMIEGTASKIFTNSLLLSKRYEKLRIDELTKHIAIGGFAASPDWLKVINETQGLGSIIQRNLGAFEWAGLGSRLNINQIAISSAQKNFLAFSTDYATILKSIQRSPDWLTPYPELAKLPSIEYYTHTSALEVISAEEDEETTALIATSVELQEETVFSIEGYLPKLHHGLPKMWLGAQQALASANVDRIRHFNVSVRELFTHILQQLAPDVSVKSWSTNPNDFFESRPTRKARLLYICRELQGGTYGKFLDKDLANMLELINLFQGGTHGIDSDLTDTQLFALKLRVECALRFLLEVEFKTNRN